jgi:hypothetical protein
MISFTLLYRKLPVVRRDPLKRLGNEKKIPENFPITDAIASLSGVYPVRLSLPVILQCRRNDTGAPEKSSDYPDPVVSPMPAKWLKRCRVNTVYAG